MSYESGYPKTCSYGSGLEREAIHDARGIFVTFVCEQCQVDRLSSYRPDIFTDPSYPCDEQIEPDYDDWD